MTNVWRHTHDACPECYKEAQQIARLRKENGNAVLMRQSLDLLESERDNLLLRLQGAEAHRRAGGGEHE